MLFLCWILQHAVVFVNGDQYYGAKASINVWAPRVTDQYEFSLSQIWVISGTFGNDLNTIEAGWQVCSSLYFQLPLETPERFSLLQKSHDLVFIFSISRSAQSYMETTTQDSLHIGQ